MENEIIMVVALMVEEDSQRITSQISIKGVHKEDVVEAVEGMINLMFNATTVTSMGTIYMSASYECKNKEKYHHKGEQASFVKDEREEPHTLLMVSSSKEDAEYNTWCLDTGCTIICVAKGVVC